MMANRQIIANIVLIGDILISDGWHKLMHNVNNICGRCNSKHAAACTRAAIRTAAVQYKAMATVATTKQMTTPTTMTVATTTMTVATTTMTSATTTMTTATTTMTDGGCPI